MLKKLKQKLLSFSRVKIFVVLALFAITGGVFVFYEPAFVSTVNAKDIPATSIQTTLGVSDNFFRVDKNGTVTVKVSLTLNTPDEIDMGKDPTVSDNLSRGGIGDPITGIQIGVLNKTKNDTLCKNVPSILGSVVASLIYHCSFTYTTSNWPNWSVSQVFGSVGAWKKGQTLTFDVALSTSDLQNLGVTYSDTGDLNELYFYPNFYMFGIANNTAFSPAKSVFVQGYNTTEQVTAAQNLPRPVEANGTTSSKPNQSPGGSPSLLGLINSIIGIILGILQELIYAIFFWLIAPVIQAMLSIHPYTDAFVAVIYPGWVIVRNICNIFFIVALIVIAMATLIRVESYQFRHLLVQLIIAALLVNFSLVIGQAVLGLADTVQSQFLPANVTVIRSLAGNLMVGYRGTLTSTNLFNGTFAGTIQPLFWLALSLGSFAVFCAIAAFLLIRIVALWILLMISPIAYAVGVLPTTAHYRAEWWQNFLKYAFFTPIMAFFLNMAAVMADASKTNPILQQINSGNLAQQLNAGQSGLAAFVVQVASNLLLLIFLVAALKVADMAGVYGASGITSMAQKGIFAPFAGAGFLAKRGGGYVARRYNEETAKLVTDKHGLAANLKKGAFAVLNPVNFFKGWQERSHEKKEWAEHLAQGAGQMVASELLTGGRERINYKELALQKIQRNIAGKLRESLGDDPGRAASMDLQRRINEVKGFEGQILRGAAALLTGNQGWGDDTNEVASDSHHDREHWEKELKERGTNKAGMKLFEEACKTYDDQGFETMQWVYQGLDLNMLARLRGDQKGEMYKRDEHDPHKFADAEFQKFIEGNQLQLMNVAALTDGAKKVGHYEQMFMAKKDDKSGLFIPLVDSEWAKKMYEADIKNGTNNFDLSMAPRSGEIIGEVNKIGIRRFWQDTAWHNFIRKVKKVVKRDDKGQVISERRADWDEDGEWAVGDLTDDNSLLQNYLWTTTMAGKKYASQAGHAQARIIQYVVGKTFNKEGQFKDQKSKDEYKRLLGKNKELTEIMTFMQLTGNPPREIDFLYDVLVKHGNTPEELLRDCGIQPPTDEQRIIARGQQKSGGGTGGGGTGGGGTGGGGTGGGGTGGGGTGTP